MIAQDRTEDISAQRANAVRVRSLIESATDALAANDPKRAAKILNAAWHYSRPVADFLLNLEKEQKGE